MFALFVIINKLKCCAVIETLPCVFVFLAARTTTMTTTILETKGGDAVSSPSVRVSKRTVTDDLYSTFSSPVAWVLVLALIVTWSAVAIIVFDLVDTKGLEGRNHVTLLTVKVPDVGFIVPAVSVCACVCCFNNIRAQPDGRGDIRKIRNPSSGVLARHLCLIVVNE